MHLFRRRLTSWLHANSTVFPDISTLPVLNTADRAAARLAAEDAGGATIANRDAATADSAATDVVAPRCETFAPPMRRACTYFYTSPLIALSRSMPRVCAWRTDRYTE